MMTLNNGEQQIETFFQGGVLRVGICRPEKKNALTQLMYQLLTAAIEQAEQDERVRVILLHGTADCFTSGNDLTDFAQNPPRGEDSPVFCFLRAISAAQKPLIAVVNGPAVGIGTTLLLHCDLVFAGEDARFQLPFVNLGLCPEAASSYLLPQLAGHLRASELLLLGEAINARRAEQLGLVNRVYPAQKLFQCAIFQAQQLAQKPAAAVRLTKSLLKQGQAKQVTEVMSKEGKLFLELLQQPEAKAAIGAFLQGRLANSGNADGTERE
ncbi:MAG TPA: enoyl-CoA hydratase [Malonomonas sp.]